MADRRELDATSYRRMNILRFGALGLVVLVVGVVWISAHTGAALAGEPVPPANPARLLADLASGKTPWPVEATAVAVGFGLLLFALVLLVARRVGVRRRGRKRHDDAALRMSSRRDLAPLTEAGARAVAERLGVPAESAPGVPMGRALPWKVWLYSNWEYMIVVVAGPRTMKSTAYAIPAIMAAPAAVLATSNKPDVVFATRETRETFGEVWTFDPQGIARTPITWWWNPLTYIAPFDGRTKCARRDPRTGWVDASEARAEKLAGQFCASAIVQGAKTDAYFDGEAENLIGLMLLAAACGDEQLTVVYSWLATPTNDTAVDHLRANGFELQAQSLYALANLPDKQREGIYGTARARMGFLRNRELVAWVTDPATNATLQRSMRESAARVTYRQFHPAEFATSTDTLYPLSKEGEGSAGPLVAALTVAVVDALVDRANENGGRLPIPFLAVLDEAANICRFRNLDSYYSYFGSMGIVIMTILQNWAQGEEVWGVKGMEKLWSAANMKVYGGGVDDDRFLKRISDLIGQYTLLRRSESYTPGRAGNRSSVSVSTSTEERTILTIGQLRELDKRAVLFASGMPALLVEPQPWFERPELVPLIESSQAKYQHRSSPAASPAGAAPGADSASPWNVKAIGE
ncbi:type IV secretory system conjugative DNA transfer family protein [Pimelobacter sp. 30-1]|uniref:type IV secretory system conjugative DNA transfer family protein n=1 Tax=Pimelobacter sp. 30-1 TaxID=2004991 RepID=UPI001C04C4C5|nr:type IV secretory system conjugative DNA transfer family protein [Pimelobacter sp. 30-1]MBU2698565.1 hypothetical protein [Pimelobacter sp. 30-1]